jgi:hypothetical protein
MKRMFLGVLPMVMLLSFAVNAYALPKLSQVSKRYVEYLYSAGFEVCNAENRPANGARVAYMMKNPLNNYMVFIDVNAYGDIVQSTFSTSNPDALACQLVVTWVNNTYLLINGSRAGQTPLTDKLANAINNHISLTAFNCQNVKTNIEFYRDGAGILMKTK